MFVSTSIGVMLRRRLREQSMGTGWAWVHLKVAGGSSEMPGLFRASASSPNLNDMPQRSTPRAFQPNSKSFEKLLTESLHIGTNAAQECCMKISLASETDCFCRELKPQPTFSEAPITKRKQKTLNPNLHPESTQP